MPLPNWIFVQEKKDGDGSTFFDASREQGATVEDDDTVQIVGTYKLIKKLKMKKNLTIFFKPPKGKKARG